MITPEFSLEQTLDKVILKIQIKYIKTQDIQVDLNESELKVYANPYFLSLTFPMSLVESDQNTSQYDISKGILLLEFNKEIQEIIPDLEFKLLNSLNSSKTPKFIRPLIQDLSGNMQEKENMQEKDQGNNSILSRCYGFNKQYSGIGRELSLISQEILEISDIDSIFSDFEKEYLSRLDQKFDIDYYLQDLEDGIFTEILQFKSEFQKLLLHIQKEEIVFNSKDLKEITKDIPRKDYIIQEKDEKSIYLGLVDLMFSFSYNYLLNCGEDNSESFWNLVKTSPTLSGFFIFSDLKQVLTTCARASLSWPLLRNWEFTLKVLKHTTIIFKLGKRGIVKALLEMKRILEGDERTFTICQIYIIDYLSWLMTSASDKTLASFASLLNHFSLEKCDIFFNEKSLVEIETIREQL